MGLDEEVGAPHRENQELLPAGRHGRATITRLEARIVQLQGQLAKACGHRAPARWLLTLLERL